MNRYVAYWQDTFAENVGSISQTCSSPWQARLFQIWVRVNSCSGTTTKALYRPADHGMSRSRICIQWATQPKETYAINTNSLTFVWHRSRNFGHEGLYRLQACIIPRMLLASTRIMPCRTFALLSLSNEGMSAAMCPRCASILAQNLTGYKIFRASCLGSDIFSMPSRSRLLSTCWNRRNVLSLQFWSNCK